MTLIEQLKRTTLQLLTVELELNEFVIQYNDEYIRENAEVIECLKCKGGTATLITNVSIDRVIIPNNTTLSLEDYLVMEDFEMRAFEILYEAGKLRATYITTDDDHDGVLELKKYDIDTHGYYDVVTNDKVDNNYYNEDGSLYVPKDDETMYVPRAYPMDDDIYFNPEDATVATRLDDIPTGFKHQTPETDFKADFKHPSLPKLDADVLVLRRDKDGNLYNAKKGFTLKATIISLVAFAIFIFTLHSLSINKIIKIPEINLSNILTFESNDNTVVGDVNAVGGNFIIGR